MVLPVVVTVLVTFDTQNIPVRDLARSHVALTQRDRRMIRAVLAASRREDRPKLIVTRSGTGGLLFWYGDPDHPRGKPTLSPGGAAIYHVLGAGCNVFIKPYEREVFPLPECGPDDKETAADRVVRRFEGWQGDR